MIFEGGAFAGERGAHQRVLRFIVVNAEQLCQFQHQCACAAVECVGGQCLIERRRRMLCVGSLKLVPVAVAERLGQGGLDLGKRPIAAQKAGDTLCSLLGSIEIREVETHGCPHCGRMEE
jgi:hypothetical protein